MAQLLTSSSENARFIHRSEPSLELHAIVIVAGTEMRAILTNGGAPRTATPWIKCSNALVDSHADNIAEAFKQLLLTLSKEVAQVASIGPYADPRWGQ